MLILFILLLKRRHWKKENGSRVETRGRWAFQTHKIFQSEFLKNECAFLSEPLNLGVSHGKSDSSYPLENGFETQIFRIYVFKISTVKRERGRLRKMIEVGENIVTPII